MFCADWILIVDITVTNSKTTHPVTVLNSDELSQKVNDFSGRGNIFLNVLQSPLSISMSLFLSKTVANWQSEKNSSKIYCNTFTDL